MIRVTSTETSGNGIKSHYCVSRKITINSQCVARLYHVDIRMHDRRIRREL